MEKQTVYVPVPVSEILPKEEGWYYIELHNGHIYVAWYLRAMLCFDTDRAERFYGSDVKFWMEKKEEIYPLTKDQLEKLFNAAQKFSEDTPTVVQEDFYVFKKYQSLDDYLTSTENK